MTLQKKSSKYIPFQETQIENSSLSNRAGQVVHLLDQHIVVAQSSIGHELH